MAGRFCSTVIMGHFRLSSVAFRTPIHRIETQQVHRHSFLDLCSNIILHKNTVLSECGHFSPSSSSSCVVVRNRKSLMRPQQFAEDYRVQSSLAHTDALLRNRLIPISHLSSTGPQCEIVRFGRRRRRRVPTPTPLVRFAPHRRQRVSRTTFFIDTRHATMCTQMGGQTARRRLPIRNRFGPVCVQLREPRRRSSNINCGCASHANRTRAVSDTRTRIRMNFKRIGDAEFGVFAGRVLADDDDTFETIRAVRSSAPRCSIE